MKVFELLQANSDNFKKGIPNQNKHLTHYTISTLAESIAEYNRHLKYFRTGKRKYPVHFRLFITRLNRFMASHFTEAVNQVWQQVKSMTTSKLFSKKHAARITCLQYLLACVVDNNDGTDGDKPGNKPSLPPAVSDFVVLMTRGIIELQTQGEGQECFRLVKAGKGKREATIRDFFRTVCAGKYEVVEAESPKGKGRIDMKVYDVVHKTRLVVEFKGFWNYKHRGRMVNQIIDYLTDADDYAFTVTINQLKKDITHQHRQLITQKKTGYISRSWEIYCENQLPYYVSAHAVNGRTIKLVHFIISIPQSC